MTNLNLLLPDQKAVRTRERLNWRLLKVALFVLALMTASYSVILAWEKTVAESKLILSDRIVSLAKNLEPFNEIEQTALFLDDRINTYEQVSANHLSWAHSLTVLARQISSDLELTTLTPAYAKDGILTLTLTGSVNSRASLLAFINRLEATEEYEKVSYQTSQITSESGPTNRIEFTLKTNLIRLGGRS